MNGKARIAELKTAKDVGGEVLWSHKLRLLISRRHALEFEREDDKKSFIPAPAEAKYRTRVAPFPSLALLRRIDNDITAVWIHMQQYPLLLYQCYRYLKQNRTLFQL